ncbi:MAG: hypothetical protein RL033_644 [Pseudomonadota bacterium]|jgi:hypothetical protein
MLDRVKREYDKLDARTRAGLVRKMNTWAKEQPLPDTHFKFEWRVPVDGKAIGVYAFKDNQARLYGATFPLNGKETFICSEIDSAKKQNKADQEKLKRAALNLRGFL